MIFVGGEEEGRKRCAADLVQRVEHLSFVLGLQNLIPFAMYCQMYSQEVVSFARILWSQRFKMMLRRVQAKENEQRVMGNDGAIRTDFPGHKQV